MWVLALDTTTRDGSVALVHDDVIVVARPGDAAVSHAERVPADLRAVLADAGVALSAIDLFAVATGPGGFTGLRIGLAAVQGLASALDRPTAGVPSLGALAWEALENAPAASTAAAWMDASRGEVFAAAWQRAPDAGLSWPLVPLAPASAASADETVTAWHEQLPPATILVAACRADASAVAATAGYRVVAPASLLAGVVGRLAWRMHRAGHTGPPGTLAPEYVRRPDVEIERDRRRAAGTPG